MGRPSLIIVSGSPGSGKTTLAHRLAAEIGCPVLSRDAIKEGMAHATPGFVAGPDDPLMMPTYDLFFAVLGQLVGGGVTVVAEAAFRTPLWRQGLDRIDAEPRVRLIRCHVDAEQARRRARQRLDTAARRAAHADAAYLAAAEVFEPVDLSLPTLDVDTADGYRPGLAEVVAFAAAD